jgi:hypothetical protein
MRFAAPLAVFSSASLHVGLAAAQTPTQELEQLRDRLNDAQRLAELVPLLSSIIGVLALVIVLLAWQLLKRPSGPAVAAMRRHVQQHEEADVTVPSELPAPSSPAPMSEPPMVTVAQPKTVEPPPGVHGSTVEEHIDVDQQAQFLLVLGQDEAAIDLLLDHLRGTGGTSPLPYLRLMQIYRRREDQAAYERTRERFNLRFNALAPQWQADPERQQSLEAYPEAVAEVQRAWASPLDAMAVIEALLFRRGSEDERFDLPAYEELLFLYWLTRELQQLSDKVPSTIDVLLPLDDHPPEMSVIQREATPRSPASYDTTAVFTQVSLAKAPASIDLDLSTQPGPDVDAP